MNRHLENNEIVLIPELENIIYYGEAETGKAVKKQLPKMIWLHNTDLGAPYFGGNFDFLYNGGVNEAFVTFNTYISFRKNYTEAQKRDFVRRLSDAVGMWDSAAELQVKDAAGNYNDKIKLRFKLNVVTTSANANKKTDVHPPGTWSSWFNGKNREIVMRDLNVFINSPVQVLFHELGHVWGLADEYDTKWIEKKFSPAHVGTDSPLLKDTSAVMNIGYERPGGAGEFRGRYFRHFGRALLNAFRGIKKYMIPVVVNGKTVTHVIQGRIALLKKDMAGSAPFTYDVPPFNKQFQFIQIRN